jgi:tetratricopeptide (TPR) repeat protein
MKFLLMTMALAIFSFLSPCYSEVSLGKPEAFESHDQGLSLVYIGFGNESLSLKKFSSALDDFQKAFSLLGKPEDHPPELDVLILFGEVIAYDNLGLKDDCSKYLAILKSIINSDNEIEDSEFSYDYNNFSLEDYQEAIETTSDLYHLASIACSKEIKEELFLIINKMFEEVQGQLYTGQNLEFQHKLTETKETVELCKAKWIKKIEKVAKNVYRIFKKVKEVWDFAKDINKTLNSNDNERTGC